MDTSSRISILFALADRIDGACVIETDAAGVFTRFGPGAEAFFAYPASEAVGRLKYDVFHDPEEMAACHGSAEFRAAIEDPGYSEAAWTVIPRVGPPFRARVTLVPIPAVDNPPDVTQNARSGWLALYRRLPA